MTQARQTIYGKTSASAQYGMAGDDPRRLVGHDISADQIADKPAENDADADRDDMAGDDPRRLVGHDISADQIADKPAENDADADRDDMAGDDPRRLVGHDVQYSSLQLLEKDGLKGNEGKRADDTP